VHSRHPTCGSNARLASNLLSLESELYLAHLYGQHPSRYVFSRGAPNFRGIPARLFLHLIRLAGRFLFDFGRVAPSSASASRILLFSSSRNQTIVLDPVFRALRRIGASAVFLYDGPSSDPGLPDDHCSLRVIGTPRVYVTTLRLLFHRLRPLLSSLGEVDSRLADWRLDRFLVPHFWVCFFLDSFKERRPSLVIVANDHNSSNRSLMLVCRSLGIRSAFLQHASASRHLPALNFDYAFLDGASALAVYSDIESIRRVGGLPPLEPRIFLSGQKKPVRLGSPLGQSPDRVGFALKAIDPLDVTRKLIDQLLERGVRLTIRWHPGQSSSFRRNLSKCLEHVADVEFSDPARDSLPAFFSKVCCVLAGNSSIHLEAALAGRPAFYYECWKDSVDDYYGYVAAGLAKRLNSVDDIVYNWELARRGDFPSEDQVKSIRNYSASYRTEYEGREGELVAFTVLQLMESNQSIFFRPFDGSSAFADVRELALSGSGADLEGDFRA